MLEKNSVARDFSEHFRQLPQYTVFAPGLINLMGEHTDYNQGLQIYTSISLGVWAGVAARADNQLHLVCNYFPDETRSWEMCALVAQDNEFDWSNVLRSLTERLFAGFSLPTGLNLYLHCELPASAGFSIVYSVLYAVAVAVLRVNQQPFDSGQLGRLCWEVKRKHGRIDPTQAKPQILASAQAATAYLYDAQHTQLTPFALNPTWKFFVVDLAEPKQFLDSAIAQRTVQCQTAASALGVDHLSQLELTQLESEKTNLEDLIYKRALHVVSENARCRKMVQLLGGSDMAALARCCAQSQLSLRQDYDVTTDRLDRWVDQLKNLLGDDVAVRLNGGGFGGSLVLITNAADTQALTTKVHSYFPDIRLMAVEPAALQVNKLALRV